MLKSKYAITTRNNTNKNVRPLVEFLKEKNFLVTDGVYRYFSIAGTTQSFKKGITMIKNKLKGIDKSAINSKSKIDDLNVALAAGNSMDALATNYSTLGGKSYPKTFFDILCTDCNKIIITDTDISGMEFSKEPWFHKIYTQSDLLLILLMNNKLISQIVDTTNPLPKLFPITQKEYDEYNNGNWGEVPNELRDTNLYQVGRSKGNKIDRTNCSIVKCLDPMTLLGAKLEDDFAYVEGKLVINDGIHTSGALAEAVEMIMKSYNDLFQLKNEHAFTSMKSALENPFLHSTRMAHISNLLKEKKNFLMDRKTRKGLDVKSLVFNSDSISTDEEILKAEITLETKNKDRIMKRRKNAIEKNKKISEMQSNNPITQQVTTQNQTKTKPKVSLTIN